MSSSTISSNQMMWCTGSTTLQPHDLLKCSWAWSTNLGCLVYIGCFQKKMVPPKSSILIGFSIINHPFWGTPIFGNTHIYTIIYMIYLYIPRILFVQNLHKVQQPRRPIGSTLSTTHRLLKMGNNHLFKPYKNVNLHEKWGYWGSFPVCLFKQTNSKCLNLTLCFMTLFWCSSFAKLWNGRFGPPSHPGTKIPHLKRKWPACHIYAACFPKTNLDTLWPFHLNMLMISCLSNLSNH